MHGQGNFYMAQTTMIKQAFIAFGITASLLASHTVCADYYKWVDDKGIPRYSETPPVGIQAERIKSSGVSIPSATQGPATTQEAQEALKQKEHSQQVEDKQKKAAEELANKCKIAQDQVKTLSDNHRVRVKESDGTEHWLTAEEQAAQLSKLQSFVQEKCSNTNP